MMDPQQVGWGQYDGYEGPFYAGSLRYSAGPTASAPIKALFTVSSTEGSALDAFNGYDRAVYSLGLIQWAGATGMAAKLLDAIAKANPSAVYDLDAALASLKLDRAALKTQGTNLAQALYGCSGRIGSWTEGNKRQGKEIAALMIDVLRDPVAQDVQVQWTLDRLLGFVTKEVRPLLFEGGLVGQGLRGVLQVVYLSFAANLPEVASKHFLEEVRRSGGCYPEDRAFVLRAIQRMTLGPRILIYPDRYAALLKGGIEARYGEDLPDTVALLGPWDGPRLPTTKEVQQTLLALGYNLGPAGADGKAGSKTKAAVIAFQKKNGLTPDGLVGAKTWDKLEQELRSG